MNGYEKYQMLRWVPPTKLARPVHDDDFGDLEMEPDEDDGCCPGCGACPGFTGVDCDETCEWATTGGGAA